MSKKKPPHKPEQRRPYRAVRVPLELYEQVAARAEKIDRSATWLIVRMVRQALAQSPGREDD